MTNQEIIIALTNDLYETKELLKEETKQKERNSNYWGKALLKCRELEKQLESKKCEKC